MEFLLVAALTRLPRRVIRPALIGLVNTRAEFGSGRFSVLPVDFRAEAENWWEASLPSCKRLV